MEQTLETLLARLSIASSSRSNQNPRNLSTRVITLGRDPTKEEINIILNEVGDNFGELIKDPSANYYILRLIKACDERQRTRIVITLCHDKFSVIGACLDSYGTRAIQKLLETATSPQTVALLISAISHSTLLLSIDPNGHHVIQHCLMKFSDQDNRHIISAISKNCIKIATSKTGCCVLQCCVENCRGQYRERILADIISGARRLSQDPYGNYVVQHLVSLQMPEIMDNLLRQLQGNFLVMSCNKYASNVVEKLLTQSGTVRSSQIIQELLGNQNVCLLLVHPFGNFVIQSALAVSQGFARSALIGLVQLSVPFMLNNRYGRKVLERVNRITMGYL